MSEGRTRREFHYTNEDNQEGFIEVSFGPWGGQMGELVDAPIMVSFEDAAWMGADVIDEFARWFKVAIVEAKRRHQPRRGGRADD